ncbi:UNVERIFIED_CONTAM: hypothetical protein HDU68_007319 [Siphonaria sp. JEL0065]|nr:hypothetical protein HDU68_007319 [Siphonaria sp. JEL0065]
MNPSLPSPASPSTDPPNAEPVDYFRGLDMIYEPIDHGVVYAISTFVANEDAQVSVVKGDALELLDDSNSYWWLVKSLKTNNADVATKFLQLYRLATYPQRTLKPQTNVWQD